MTVIAWDGSELVADRQATVYESKVAITKIKKINNHLLFVSGSADAMMELFAWYEQGADPAKWPAAQNDKDRWSGLNVITPDKTILRYERTPYPWVIEEPFFAIGSGMDFAMAVMAMGYGARKAVEIASQLSPNCGLGMDILTLD